MTVRTIAIATLFLASSGMIAAAEDTKPSMAEPVPTPSSATGAAGKHPTPVAERRMRGHIARRPVGEPIVKGNTDIFVDSYGELSTTIQP